ncbi:MAG: hypothetical protein QOE65_63 [Solirubrobacteraceae bacterium]|nr:hypothetical protein [Solirubrobacteraceae bacterium]
MGRRLVIAALALSVTAAAPAHAERVSLRPAVAPPGAVVAAEGSGWKPGALVQLRRAGARPLGAVRVGPDGTFARSFRVPALAPRAYGFAASAPGVSLWARLQVVRDFRDWAPRDIVFRSPRVAVSVSRTVAFPTAPVLVLFRGLRRGTLVMAHLAGGRPGYGRAGPRGLALVLLRVPYRPVERSALELRAGALRTVEPFYVLPPQTVVPPLPHRTRAVPVLAAAGDVACHPGVRRTLFTCRQADTARQLDRLQPDVVAMLGDSQYDRGLPGEFYAYHWTWGRFRAHTRPAPGNHEYEIPGAYGYYGYFRYAAGSPYRGYYSYDVGRWHVVALNSNCLFVSCAAGGPQETWLRADLAAHPRRCTLAYWHHPRWSSSLGIQGDPRVEPLWRALSDARADLVLAGHVHNYERLAPVNAVGAVDRRFGMRSFVVGTGGRGHQRLGPRRPFSERAFVGRFGVLVLSLGRLGYYWAFAGEPGLRVLDRGGAACRT